MKELIGKRIRQISVNDDQSILSFATDDVTVSYVARGGCCSESWFADITGVDALLGGTVQSADEVNMDGYNVNDGRTRQEDDEAYGWKLCTNKGYVDIVFRNSSNGYYGGWMELFIGALPDTMTTITEDWSA